ncbi:vanadium-dependent haloperoxidase [Roseicyclus sp.]|uniref:vanadium-dependent haloperoxidase n=1 Tax=Roseicyclus sp. TaxID=1914329 RepID=UPI001BCD211E|nr:vanadium-dependent haloperoxidase [Roseicyclus sp.]
MLILPKIIEENGLNDFPVLYWNHVGLEMNRITHSLGGPHRGPTMSSRALGLLHLAIHDAYFAVLGHTQASSPPTWLPDGERPSSGAIPATLVEANAALTGAAVRMLERLYGEPDPGMSTQNRETMVQLMRGYTTGYRHHIDTLSAAHIYGMGIADLIHARLAVKPGEPGAGHGSYQPRSGRYYFRDEPGIPVRLVNIDPDDPSKGQRAVQEYHGPFYGTTVGDFAVTDPDGHRLAHWPEGTAEYVNALAEVRKKGGAAHLNSTDRSPDETVAAVYWAYDGPNLIGTPPRLYNQVLRVVAWNKRDPAANPADTTLAATLDQSSEFVRVLALANVAMADAGKFAWKEKYRFELWRPMSGIREHDPSAQAGNGGAQKLTAEADPFWLALGAPETNSDRISFKPPFPAYPSGHATFGAACFQMARLYYASVGKAMVEPNGTDNIAFTFVSEELNGICRDLYQPHDPGRPIEDQPGLVRTYVERRFNSLWRAIWENAFSRIWLGVHWRYDAFDYADAGNGKGGYKDPDTVAYSNVWTAPRAPDAPDSALPTGGVPLGLGIANDIWANAMRAP